jgi:hypothetical protein
MLGYSPPYDNVRNNGDGPSYLQELKDYGSEKNTVAAELQVCLDEITAAVDDMSALATVGLYMIYVQAVDSAGYFY